MALLALGLDQLIKHGLRSIKTSGMGAFNKVMDGRVNSKIVIGGSSRAQVQYDPEVLQRVTGLTAFNIGRNGSHIDMQLAVLKAYLRHNVKPTVVIHNLDMHSFIPTQELYDPAQYLPYLDDPDIFHALLKIDHGAWKWKYIPLYGFAVQDMRLMWMLGLRGLFGFQPKEDHFLGYNPRDLFWTGEFERFKAQAGQGYNVEIRPSGIRALQELIELCSRQEIHLILVYAPEYYEAQALALNRSEIFETFRKIAAHFQVPLWDYSDSIISRDRNLFYNSQHLNRHGAQIFSENLAARLSAAGNALPPNH